MAAPKIARPPLESGDRLTRAEFHRRYEARPDLERAELVEGVVYVSSPNRYASHDAQTTAMILWLATYAARRPGVRAGGSATIYLDARNEVQPDAFLFRPDAPPGARVRDDGYIEGAPQLIIEVAASTASYDLHDKMEAYRRNGVREYVVWRVLDDVIDWFRLREGRYERIEPDARGMIESAEFPGLRLDVAKMLAGDVAGVLAALEG